MARKETHSSAGLIALAVGATAGMVGVIGAALWPRKDTEPRAPTHTFSELDIEALARMFASENPRGSEQLKVEQAWTQLRSLARGQTLYDRITGGTGWGKQIGRRPVSTENEARSADRLLAAKILGGSLESILTGAKQFFEPEQQDRSFRIAEVARAKQKRGEPLNAQEQRLLGYHTDANGIRRKWAAEGRRRVDEIEGVEFWT